MTLQVQDMFMHPGPEPNGLQATEDGLWVIDQTDNHAYKLDWEDGSTLEKAPATVEHSSGITLGDGFIWISSTFDVDYAGDQGSPKLVRCNMDGSTSARYDTPGSRFHEQEERITGAHGMEWIDNENMWVAVPPSQTVYLLNPTTMSITRSFPCPGGRPHGLFFHRGYLWLADAPSTIHKLNMADGGVLDTIEVPSPEVHGMTVHEDRLWFCCAVSRRICSIEMPA